MKRIARRLDNPGPPATDRLEPSMLMMTRLCQGVVILNEVKNQAHRATLSIE
jgi:hypothetical protein